MNDSKVSLIKRIKTNKKFQYIVLFIALVVIVFIFLVGTLFNGKPKSQSSDLLTNYVSTLESKLSNTLSQVSGAGRVSVVITVESGMETVLANKITTTTTINGTEIVETPIIVNGKTVVLKELLPKVIGVLIVCEGANNISVMTKIQQATVSLLDININQIEILAMK